MKDVNTQNRSLGVAVVGTGWGCLTHVPALRAAGFDVRTLVGTDPERTSQRAIASDVPQASTDLDRVLADASIDAVVVATPPETHVDVVLAAVAAGKHVLCEKPFATTLTDAIRMRDAARSNGVVHAVGHEFRWQPHMAATAQTIRSGVIGDPTLVTHVRINGIIAGPQASAPGWFQKKENFGGWPNAEIQHVVDEIRMSVGEFATVTAMEGQVTKHDWDAPETFLVQFTTVDGAMGTIQSSIGAYGPMVNLQRVTGTAGSVWTAMDGTVMVHDGTSERIVEPRADLVGDPSDMPTRRADGIASSNTLSAALSGATRFIRPTQLLHEAFRDRILGRERTEWPPLPTFDDGVANTAVHAAIRRSVETNLPQTVDAAVVVA
ncbi:MULTISPECIES: Gfo/Idh/MocA family protein [unclassified Rhodococcus (in: high G+C Gram-positive bacteria)]|uniref:Gfo/Idh/MocA family protein n=1 Tax=unclassified Rhodococcus (in: high G+C Gram-positive bacteria) TaxID=192944 RepID=UPI000A52B682|nr:Gfo/Idh/MocA family oxidoreductase [Rhodococcus sp. M8]QPG43092.1 Gfo/Idh/MocA family oxidoreductase [Rhodococcus sp. M8]